MRLVYILHSLELLRWKNVHILLEQNNWCRSQAVLLLSTCKHFGTYGIHLIDKQLPLAEVYSQARAWQICKYMDYEHEHVLSVMLERQKVHALVKVNISFRKMKSEKHLIGHYFQNICSPQCTLCITNQMTTSIYLAYKYITGPTTWFILWHYLI